MKVSDTFEVYDSVEIEFILLKILIYCQYSGPLLTLPASLPYKRALCECRHILSRRATCSVTALK